MSLATGFAWARCSLDGFDGNAAATADDANGGYDGSGRCWSNGAQRSGDSVELQIFSRPSENSAPSGRGLAAQQLLDRAAASTEPGVAVHDVAHPSERSESVVPLLALVNGSEVPPTGQAAPAQASGSAINGAVAVSVPAGRDIGTGGMNTAGSNVDEIPPVPGAADVVTSEVATAAVEQGQMSEMPPSFVARTVGLLAEAHYGKTLSEGEGRTEKSKARMKGLKKPAAAAKGPLKKPSCSQFSPPGSEVASSVGSEEANKGMSKAKKRPCPSDIDPNQ